MDSNISVKTQNKEKISQNVLISIFKKRESALFGLLVVIFIIMSALRPSTFFTGENLFNILKQVSMVTIIAVGQSFILVVGGIDLSVGFSLGLSGIVMAKLYSLGLDPYLSILAGILTSVLIGLANGLMVTKLNLPPFIVTLGMANIARGFVYVITKGFSIAVEEPLVIALGNGYFGPVPIMSIVMLVIVIFGAYLLTSTVFGSRVRAIGGNETAAALSGINVKKYKVYVYSLAGLFCGIAGIIMVGRLNAGNPNSGLNFDMDSIAATIVGGTSLAGGEGTIIGTLFGALLLGVIRNGLVLLNVNMYWQTVVAGVIIISVCALDYFAQSKRNK